MTITEKRTLRYDFTAVETHDLSMALASKNKEIGLLKKQKASVTSQYTAKINEAEASVNDLSNKVSDGYEHREVECEVIFNQPDQGKKTIIRKDSNSLVGVEKMTTQDWDKINEENNLFNQNGKKHLAEGGDQPVVEGDAEAKEGNAQADEADAAAEEGTAHHQEVEEDLLTGDNSEEGPF